jgi:hypothetical protein
MVVDSKQVSVIPVCKVTVNVYVPAAVGVPEIIKVFPEKEPITPGGKSAAGTEPAVAMVEEV